MDIRVKFLGGAGTVTGSKYLLEIDNYNLLIDCGLFQGEKELRLRNWDPMPIEPQKIDAVILTHAHIDHSGYLPLLCKNGYSGEIHCTTPTLDLLEIMLTDSAKLQEEEAEFANKKGYSRHKPALPLYEVKDAESVFPHIMPHDYKKPFWLNDITKVEFFQAGHILGAASVRITVNTSQGQKQIVFSGDIGPKDNPVHLAPERAKKADILFLESTYGGRNHSKVEVVKKLRNLLIDCDKRNGCLIIPAFSVGRTQLILYYLWELFQKTPSRPVYVDSPMAISVTNLYRHYEAYHRLKSTHEFGHHIFDAPNVHYVRDQSRSQFLNTVKNNAVIISASGMATGGRILHHLFHRLPNEQDTILFTGFLPKGTKGQQIVSGEPEVKIFGEVVPVKARIENMEELSAHADHSELMDWAKSIKKRPKMTFLVHGESEALQSLSSELEKLNWNTVIPGYLESFNLFDHV